jgi:hypothetical protein
MTQLAVPALGTEQIIGIFVWGVSVTAAFGALAWFRRRSRIARDERPPQRTKILHPAGHSLSCRIDELSDALTSSIMQATAGGAVLGIAGGGLYSFAAGLALRRFTFTQVLAQPQSYMVLSIGFLFFSALAWIVASMARSMKIHNELRNCRFGLRGEQAVAEALSEPVLASTGYVAFHDVPGDGAWNIDHVLIGPGGIFVLETKTRSRRKATRNQPDHEVWFDGQNLQFPWCNNREAATQAMRNAKWVEQFVSDFVPKDIPVQPIVVIPGWYVKTQGNPSVKAMNAKYLVTTYLPSFERRFVPQQLTAVMRRFDERCRDLEF